MIFPRTKYKLVNVLVKIGKLLLCLLVLSVISTTIRNTIFYPILPPNWGPHSTWFLIGMLSHNQHFPINDVERDKSPVKINVNMDKLRKKFPPNKSSYPQYHKQIEHLQKLAPHSSTASAELAKLQAMHPVMSEEDWSFMMLTFDVFIHACDAANLTYFLIAGSTLGSARHHGIVPWDDDLDIGMDAKQWPLIRDVLSNIDGFELYSPEDSQWKFYLKSLAPTNKPFKYPYVDIFFYIETSDSVYSLTWGLKYSVCYKRSQTFPLVYRPFGPFRKVPVPRGYRELLQQEFGDFDTVCSTGNYIHKTDSKFYFGMGRSKVLCSELYHVYPFSFQDKSLTTENIRSEVLKVGTHIISRVNIIS